jgi:hypothetical protein
MKLRILSGLHLEFEDFEPPPAGSNVRVLENEVLSVGDAKLWIPGHLHRQRDYRLGDTRPSAIRGVTRTSASRGSSLSWSSKSRVEFALSALGAMA